MDKEKLFGLLFDKLPVFNPAWPGEVADSWLKAFLALFKELVGSDEKSQPPSPEKKSVPGKRKYAPRVRIDKSPKDDPGPASEPPAKADEPKKYVGRPRKNFKCSWCGKDIIKEDRAFMFVEGDNFYHSRCMDEKKGVEYGT